MTRGRKPNTIPTVQWSIMVPVDLAFRVETTLMDPVTKRATYASRSKLIQALLIDWLQRQGTAQLPLDTSEDQEQNQGLNPSQPLGVPTP